MPTWLSGFLASVPWSLIISAFLGYWFGPTAVKSIGAIASTVTSDVASSSLFSKSKSKR